MNCAHCMRGEQENKDLDYQAVDKLLDQVSWIGTLTLTGGEISLNVLAMSHILKKCQENDICVSNIYFVTNGKKVTDDFLLNVLKWDAYTKECGDGELNALALSEDDFHDYIPSENIDLLSGLKIFNRSDTKVDWDITPLLNLGKAKNLHGYPKR